jgi:hypothetical protein
MSPGPVVGKDPELRFVGVPSGKQPHNYGKSPCSMGKSTKWQFSIAMLVYQRVE